MLNLEEHSPKTLEEAIALLDHALSDPERAIILKSGAEQFHFGPGMAIRNAWIHPRGKESNTPLTQHFIDRFGWLHADDISGLILEGLTFSVRKREFDPFLSVQRYKDHWTKMGINPESGEPI